MASISVAYFAFGIVWLRAATKCVQDNSLGLETVVIDGSKRPVRQAHGSCGNLVAAVTVVNWPPHRRDVTGLQSTYLTHCGTTLNYQQSFSGLSCPPLF